MMIFYITTALLVCLNLIFDNFGRMSDFYQYITQIDIDNMINWVLIFVHIHLMQ